MRAHTATLFLTSILVLAAPVAQADVVGAWTQNIARSKFDPGPIPMTPQNAKWEAAGSGYKVTVDTLNAQGVTNHIEYTVATLDGQDYPVKTSSSTPGYDAISYKRIDPNTIIIVYKLAGSVNRISRMIESKDGKSLVIDQLGYGPQGASNNTIVFEKP